MAAPEVVKASPPEKVGEVSLFLRTDVGDFFGFAPSISKDGKWAAAIVKDTSGGENEYDDQKLVVMTVASDTQEASFVLSKVYADGYGAALAGGRVPDEMTAEYRARADRANRWLARVAWRGLVRCEEPEGACTVSYREPEVRVTGPDGVLFDAPMWSWSAALPRDCGGTNRSFCGPAFCDRESNVMLLEVLFNEDCGGRGKQVRQLHPVELSASSGCVARAAANGSGTPP